jgi:hypothetical protein
MSGSVSIDIGVLGIPTYFGLTRFSSGWRRYALVWLGLGILACALGVAWGLIAKSPAHFVVFGVSVAQIAPYWLSVVSGCMFFLVIWQFHILTRPDIRALFIDRDEPKRA